MAEVIVFRNINDGELYKEDSETLYREFIDEPLSSDTDWLGRSVSEWNNDILFGSDYIAVEITTI